MDHKAFDDRIRDKLSGLNPKFNPDSWEDMEDMLRFSTLKPWYVRWQKALWASGLLLFSLVNFYLLWQIRSEKNMLPPPSETTKQHVVVIDTIKVVDTLFITKTIYNEALPPSANPNLSASPGNQTSLLSSRSTVPLGYQPFESNFFAADSQSGLVPVIKPEMTDPEEWLENYLPPFEVKGIASKRKRPGRKNFSNPFEARIGLTAGLVVPDPDIGERYISQRLGIYGEFALNRNLRFLTGIHFNEITYKLDDVDDNNFETKDLDRFPGYTELGRVPDEIVIENEIVQVPLHLRIYKDLNYNWSVFVSGGPTIDFLLNQSFKYEYLDIENDLLVESNEVTQEKDLKIYLGNFTGSAGIEHKFNRKFAGQMNIDYQYGLSKLGVEGRSVNALSLNLAAFYKLN